MPHELFTNSIKFRVLSRVSSKGRICVDWDVSSETLSIQWRETGLAGVPSARSGFGRTLIEEALPYQLGASTSFDLTSGDLACAVAIPLVRLEGAVPHWN